MVVVFGRTDAGREVAYSIEEFVDAVAVVPQKVAVAGQLLADQKAGFVVLGVVAQKSSAAVKANCRKHFEVPVTEPALIHLVASGAVAVEA